MKISKTWIAGIMIAFFLCSQLYFGSEHSVFSFSYVHSAQTAKKSTQTTKKSIKTAKKSTKTAKNSVKNKKDEDLWNDLSYVKCGDEITIIKGGHPVSKESKEYAELLRVCKDKM